MYALDDDGVSAHQHIVLDDDRRGGGGLNHARQHSAGTDVAVFADGGTSAENGTHVNHGSLADDGTDVDDGTHHDHGVCADFDLLTDGGTRLDASGNVLHVQQGDGTVAAVMLDDDVRNLVLIGLQDGGQLLPVAKHDLVARPEHLCGAIVDGGGFLDIELHRGLFLRLCDILNDFLCSHVLLLLLVISLFMRSPNRSCHTAPAAAMQEKRRRPVHRGQTGSDFLPRA